jgi:hypothetical protein
MHVRFDLRIRAGKGYREKFRRRKMAFPNARRRAIASIYANKQVANKLIIRYASCIIWKARGLCVVGANCGV